MVASISTANAPPLTIVRLLELVPIYLWAFVLFILGSLPIGSLKSIATFAYYCFLRPLGKSVGQQSRLDKFYQGQAQVYDQTRTGLLKGRKKMLRLLAAEIKARSQNGKKPVWVDVGGGTGTDQLSQDGSYVLT